MQETEYVEACYSLNTMLEGQTVPDDAGVWHIVGLEAVLQPATAHLVHHFVVNGYYDRDDCGFSGPAPMFWGCALVAVFRHPPLRVTPPCCEPPHSVNMDRSW